MISIRLAGVYVVYSGLSWSSSDPGGFESCSFVLERALVSKVSVGDEIYVLDGQSVCWHGYVEEPGLRSDHAKETYNVSAVGYGAKLKQNPYSQVYIDRKLSEWGEVPLPRNIAVTTSSGSNVQDGAASVSVAAGETVGNGGYPAIVLAFTNITVTSDPRKALCETWYDAGHGNVIDSISFSYETYTNSSATGFVGTMNNFSATWVNKCFLSTDDAALLTDSGTDLAAEGTETVTATTTTRRYGALQLYYGAVIASTDGNWKFMVFNLHVIGNHGLTLVGDYPNQGYTPSLIVEHALKKSQCKFDTLIDDSPGYVIRQLVFRTPVVPEEVISTASKFVGWHWGVWEPQSMFSSEPCFVFQAPPSTPNAFVRYDDCENVDITEKYSDMFNRALVSYSLPNGTAKNVVVTKAHPSLPASVEHTVPLDAGTVGSEGAARTIGAYQLALLQDSARAAGSATLPRVLADGRRAHLLKPGRDKLRIIGLPSQQSFFMDSKSGLDSFRLRRLSVSVENGYPHSQIEFDHGADLIEVLQARLTNAAEAKNLA